MKKIHTKKGAASFYIVAFSTLILVVIAISFATVVLAEVARTSNADLSQSAYDAALAGIEDAKIAFLKYKKCLENPNAENGNAVTCADIINYMKNPDCDMVAHILSRYEKSENGEVIVKETTEGDNQMNQAYTCVTINTELSDYRSSLSTSNPSRVVKMNLDGISANNVTAIQFSWYSDNNGTEYNFANVQNDGKIIFPQLDSSAGTPPTVSLQLVQTASNFTLSSFDKTEGDQTNRGTIYLVPTNNFSAASNNMENNHFAAYNNANGINSVPKSAILRSNNHGESGANLPYAVYCDPNSDSEFICSARVELPSPVGGARADDTFMFVVSLPYGTPSTDFSIQLYCGSEKCAKSVASGADPSKKYDVFEGIQVNIDSTGRANDLYRRIETRLETTDIYFPYPEYTVQLFGTDGGASIDKDIYTTSEYGL